MKFDKYSFLIFLLFLALLGMRVIHMTADPPAELSWSGGLFFDEGALAHNARNQVLFGQWKMDEWNDFYYSPILAYIKWVIFAVFGVGMWQLRLVSLLFTGGTLALVYFLLKISQGRLIAALGLLLFGGNYLYVMYSRLGLTEISVVFFAVLTLYFWLLGMAAQTGLKRGTWMMLAGVSCFMVYIFKALMIYFLPVPFAALALFWIFPRTPSERKRMLRMAGWCLLGTVLIAALWLWLFYFPNYEPIHQAGDFVKMLSFPKSTEDFVHNMGRTPFFDIFLQTPVHLVLACGYFLYLLYLLLHDRAKFSPIDAFTTFWFLAHLAFFLGYSYRPTRYYVPIIPAMSILTVRALSGMLGVSAKRVPFILRGIGAVLLVCLLVVNGLSYAEWVRNPLFTVRNTSRELGEMLDDAFIAGLPSPMLCMENTHRALYVWENFTNYQDTFQKYPITHLFLAEFNDEVDYYTRKFPDVMRRARLLKTYQLKGSRFHLFSVIEPSIEDLQVSQHSYAAHEPVQISFEIVNNDSRQAKLFQPGIMLVSEDSVLPIVYAKEMVNIEPGSKVDRSFSQYLEPGTYQVLATISSEHNDVYEVEDLPSQSGTPTPDPKASGGNVRIAPSNFSGFLAYGPYQHYPTGQYTVEFVLKYRGELADENLPILALDVSADSGRTILAKKVVTKAAITESDTYQNLQLAFSLKKAQELEFRIATYGKVNVWADAIKVSYVPGTWHPAPIIVRLSD